MIYFVRCEFSDRTVWCRWWPHGAVVKREFDLNCSVEDVPAWIQTGIDFAKLSDNVKASNRGHLCWFKTDENFNILDVVDKDWNK